MKIRIPAAIRPFRLITADIRSLRQRYASDWTTFNQLIFASAVYVFFTNLLPGITFASDLYVLTGKSWGTIEVVLSTGLCGVVFALCVRNTAADILYTFAPTPITLTYLHTRFSVQPLTILGVTGPFSVLAENIYSFCTTSFHVSLFTT